MNLDELPAIWAEKSERVVLGAMLAGGDDDLMAKCVMELGAEDFFHQGHQVLYAALIDMWQSDMPLELTAVDRYLVDRKLDGKTGGVAYLAELMAESTAAVFARHHVGIVREKSFLRRLHGFGAKCAMMAHESADDVPAAMAEADRGMGRLMDRWISKDVSGEGETVKGMNRCMLEFADNAERMMKQKTRINGLPTGFYALDLLLKGIQPGEYWVIAAEPGLGKTAFILNMMLEQSMKRQDPETGAWVSPGHRVGFFSIEMNHQQLAERMVSLKTGVVSGTVRTPQKWREDADTFEKAMGGVDSLSDLPITIDADGVLTPEKMAARARWMVRSKGVEIIYLDYLQIMSLSEKVSGGGDIETITTQQCSSTIRKTAKALNVPFVVLAQFNKDGWKGGEPSIHNIKGSGQIVQDAHTILLLTDKTDRKEWRPGDPRVIKLTIAKARSAERFCYQFFDYDGPTYSFKEQQRHKSSGGGMTSGGRDFK